MSHISFIDSIPTAGATKIPRHIDTPANSAPIYGRSTVAQPQKAPAITIRAIPAIKKAGPSLAVIVPLPKIVINPTIAPSTARIHATVPPVLV